MPVPQHNLGSKRGSEATEWGEGVFPPPTVGKFFENSCMENGICFAPLLGGRLCEVAYTNPLLPPFNFFHSNQGGGGAWALVPLSYASASGAAGICQPRSKRGSEATEWGESVFPLPTVGNFFVENSCMKTAFFMCAHYNAIIRG